jgi:hypothetical protein
VCRPSRAVSDPTAVRLMVGHALTVTDPALAFLQDARRRGDVCRLMDWMAEVHHPIGNGEAVIPDALLYSQSGPVVSDGGPMLGCSWKSTEPPWARNGLAAKLTAYARLHFCVPRSRGPGRASSSRGWRSGGGATRSYAATRDLVPFLHQVPVLAAPLTVLFQHGPAEPVWRPVQNPDSRVSWYQPWQER